MNLLGGRIRSGVQSGAPFAIEGAVVTPRAFGVVVQLPFAAWVWNTPVGVDVDRNGVVERAVVVDVTRWLLITMSVVVLLAGAQGIRRSLEKGIER